MEVMFVLIYFLRNFLLVFFVFCVLLKCMSEFTISCLVAEKMEESEGKEKKNVSVVFLHCRKPQKKLYLNLVLRWLHLFGFIGACFAFFWKLKRYLTGQ